MINLLIDIGNSRIKLALTDNNDYEYLGAFSIQKVHTANAAEQFLSQLDFIPEDIYISSVADPALDMELRTAIATKWNILPVFMSTQSECCGVANGYEKTFTLGVDRWLALMGAQAHSQSSFIVIDAGTAITVDYVSDNQHKGGVIVPGLSTLRHSLTDSTANLEADCAPLHHLFQSDGPADLLATNTQSAICGGTLYMAAAFINQIINDIQNSGEQPAEIIFTGGDGELLSSLTNVHSEYVEDLVLQGIINVKESIKKG